MTTVGRWFRAREVVSRWALVCLILAVLVAVVGLFFGMRFAQSQADASDARAECRSRIANYTEGLSIELKVTEAMGLLNKVGAHDLTISFDVAVVRAKAAAVRLEEARPYREDSVAICAENPDFDPKTDITPEGP